MCKLYSSDIPKIVFINFYPAAVGDPANPVTFIAFTVSVDRW
jgi:hypothetical protein